MVINLSTKQQLRAHLTPMIHGMLERRLTIDEITATIHRSRKLVAEVACQWRKDLMTSGRLRSILDYDYWRVQGEFAPQPVTNRTHYPPGSIGRVEEYRRRVIAGERLFSDLDEPNWPPANARSDPLMRYHTEGDLERMNAELEKKS